MIDPVFDDNRKGFLILLLAVTVAGVIIAVLVAAFGSVPNVGNYPPGAGFAFVLVVGLAGVVSLGRAIHDSRVRRSSTDRTNDP